MAVHPSESANLRFAQQRYQNDLHAALLLGCIPVVGVLIAWRIVADSARSPTAPSDWRRSLLIGLLAFDLLLAVGLVSALTVRGPRPIAIHSSATAEDQGVIGIVLPEDPDASRFEIAAVRAGSAADRAGLAPGDRLVGADGEPLGDRHRLLWRIGHWQADEVHTLDVERRGATQRSVTLELTTADLGPRVLMPPAGQDAWRVECAGLVRERLRPDVLAVVVLSGVVLAGFFVFLRQRGAARRIDWMAVGIPILALTPFAALLPYGICRAWPVVSSITPLVHASLQSVMLLLLSAWAAPRARAFQSRRVQLGAPLSFGTVLWRAILYDVTISVRCMLLVIVAMALQPGPLHLTHAPIHRLFTTSDSRLGSWLLFVAAAVIAPIAEELFFRGVLLTSLARTLPWSWAIFWSAAIFGLWHIPSHGFGAFMPLALGFLLGWMRLRSGRLGPGMALHAIHNGVLVLLTIALRA